MVITLLYPVCKLLTCTSTGVVVTRYHYLTGAPSTFTITQTDITIHTKKPIVLKDVLHTFTPQAYKNDTKWPFEGDDCVDRVFASLDLLFHGRMVNASTFHSDRSVHNISSLQQIITETYVTHDDLGYIDTLDPYQCYFNDIVVQTDKFVKYLSDNFTCPIDRTEVIVQAK